MKTCIIWGLSCIMLVLLSSTPILAADPPSFSSLTQKAVKATVLSVVQSFSNKWKNDPFKDRTPVVKEEKVEAQRDDSTATSIPSTSPEVKPPPTSLLKLKGVFSGSSGKRAMISGKMVRVGDKVTSQYRVKAIHPKSVDLVDANGLIITLELNQ